jgi:hypothetical protein
LSIKALKKDQEKADMDAFLSQKEEPHRVEEDWKQELRDLSKTLDLPDADRPGSDGSAGGEISVSADGGTDPTGGGVPEAETPEEAASEAAEEGEEEKPEG